MIDEEINQIFNSNKSIQWKANQIQNIGKKIYDLFDREEFQSQFFKIAPVLKCEIESRQQQISRIEETLELNEELFKQKNEIENKYIKLHMKQKLLAELKEKNKFLNLPENNLSKIHYDISKFNSKNNSLLEGHIKTLQKLNDNLAFANNDLDQQLVSKIDEANKNLAFIQNRHFDVLSQLDPAPIKSTFNEFGNEINSLVEKYNAYVNKINTIKTELDDISKKHDDVIETFKAHHFENENIYGALESREGVLNHIKLLSNEIEDRLLKYDTEIKAIVQRRNELPIYKLEEAKKYQS